MENLLQNTLIQLLGVIITGGIAIASAYMGVFVAKATQKAKIEIAKLEDERQQAILNNTLEKATDLINTNIIAMENTVKKELLESINDGKIDKSELKKLAEQVRDNVLKQLGDGSVSILNDAIGDLSGYLEVKIEEQLSQIKNQIA